MLTVGDQEECITMNNTLIDIFLQLVLAVPSHNQNTTIRQWNHLTA